MGTIHAEEAGHRWFSEQMENADSDKAGAKSCAGQNYVSEHHISGDASNGNVLPRCTRSSDGKPKEQGDGQPDSGSNWYQVSEQHQLKAPNGPK